MSSHARDQDQPEEQSYTLTQLSLLEGEPIHHRLKLETGRYASLDRPSSPDDDQSNLDSSRKQVAMPPETALCPLSGEQESTGDRPLRLLKPHGL